jgi:hypothetical protein
LNRVENHEPSEKIEVEKYAISKPEGHLEKDIQAWRIAVANAKIQSEYHENRLLNYELVESYGVPVWLKHNSALDGVLLIAIALAIVKIIILTSIGIKRAIDNKRVSCERANEELNFKRKSDQEQLCPKLRKISKSTTDSVLTSVLIRGEILDKNK